MEEHLGFWYASVTADSGYKSEETYDYLGSLNQKPYIKPKPIKSGKDTVSERT